MYPYRTSADKQIRHRACSLRDYAFTLIKKEMDSDFEVKCQEISKKRKDRKACVSQYLPAYINTASQGKIGIIYLLIALGFQIVLILTNAQMDFSSRSTPFERSCPNK